MKHEPASWEMPGRVVLGRACWGLVVAVGLVLGGGCRGEGTSGDPRGEGGPPPGTSLSLAVVGDEALAGAIRQFEAEWHDQTGLAYHVEAVTEEQLASVGVADWDAMICPSWQLGPLAETGRIVPVPRALVASDAGNVSEVFSLLRVHEAAWGGQGFGVPFGSAVLVCYCRKDVLEALGEEPPEDWGDYLRLAGRCADREALGDRVPVGDGPWRGAIEPLGPGWAGMMLLARAASYATHREIYSTLFDVESMDALVGGPPFVRALEELVAAAPHGSPAAIDWGPGEVRAAFWRGEAALAVSWPTRTADVVPRDDRIKVRFAPLPGSAEVYNFLDGRWEPRHESQSARVPLLGAAGRLGVVTRSCQWPEAAFQLLFWLAQGELARQISTTSSATTLFRQSHVGSPSDWVERPVDAAAAAGYATVIQETLGGQRCLFALRLAGRADYLRALDDAVRRALAGQATPEEALAAAAERWNRITDRIGRQAQQEAYLHSLGQP